MLTAAGCSWLPFIGTGQVDSQLEEVGQGEDEQQSAQAVDQAGTQRAALGQNNLESDSSDVEIVWEIADAPVDRYVIRYGFLRGVLDKEILVASEALSKTADPEFGSVYKYTLKGIPANQPLFVSIAAEYQGELSAPSEVFEVPVASLSENPL